MFITLYYSVLSSRYKKPFCCISIIINLNRSNTLLSCLQNGESKPIPAEKRASTDEKPKKKALPELDKYWKVVNDDPTDFTGWTYLLQYVDQEVKKQIFIVFFVSFQYDDKNC